MSDTANTKAKLESLKNELEQLKARLEAGESCADLAATLNAKVDELKSLLA